MHALANCNGSGTSPTTRVQHVPQWGFASSPLVVDDKVIVFTGAGKSDKAVIAYDSETGEPAWTSGKGTHGYASGQLVRIADTPQVLFTSNYGIESFNPIDGSKLWEFVHGNEATESCHPANDSRRW